MKRGLLKIAIVAMVWCVQSDGLPTDVNGAGLYGAGLYGGSRTATASRMRSPLGRKKSSSCGRTRGGIYSGNRY